MQSHLRWVIFGRISALYKKWFGQVEQLTTEAGLDLQIVPRDGHDISRKHISPNAIKVLYRLHKAGYKGYLVGGGVRDLLLGLEPKDFDVATDATPEQVKKLFRNCRLVGRRFRLAHILFGREIIEVATLRGHHESDNSKIAKTNQSGRLLRDNVYGNIDEDAERRDFTVNAMYYDISDFSVRAYGGALQDLQAGRLRLIGDPETRYREDPVRMLRAVRFATKLDMHIDKDAAAPIVSLAPLLKDIPAARMYEEALKLFFNGKAEANYQLMQQYQLFGPLFPMLASAMDDAPNGSAAMMALKVMQATDARVAQDKPVTPSFFYAALLWYPLAERAVEIANEAGLNSYDAHFAAMGDVLEMQNQRISLPRRHATPTKDIWQLQLRLERSMGSRAFKLIELPKFRAGYDLLLLRADVEGGRVAKLADWWTQFVEGDDAARRQLVRGQGGGKRPQNRRRRRPRQRPAAKPQGES
ncbi:polynucleotide adenylyltransferase PcnB [Paraferrimonas sedimenticola]|uniref:Poly(A) polymerase I n=1 Tax=Paraferrimonas sedimenticola TaxID=375674 RepID=A0AA37RTV7_9GAMM|nr:polynucleotide adenylyltransferase PcnB [Paraferrimonas sedimenticola]GLP95630.1 poly(A) polymerase I [Paraferrimonas sedimenticola]